jgi:hypothetical protein
MIDEFEKMMLESIRSLRKKAEREGYSDDVEDWRDELSYVVEKCNDVLFDLFDRNNRKLAVLVDHRIRIEEIPSLEIH